ncbi:hypothetical protein LEN26_009395 [Aphanomyces euteiches]|nr:hypothetical protein AeMF1_018610 [Aphanomyces euteiches]KAH9126232.1 hypothetical protein LEN26_009395 [Aphanomyces euteiches]KAH9186094.1 hypothetical protein AeNC1_011930 [Aphanomyces euteiches]
MISIAELGFLMIAGTYLIGRKELPRVARSGGRYVGRSIGAVLRAKNEYFEATKNSDIVKMQAELQKGLDELNMIRAEMTNISSMKRPYRPVSTPANRPSVNPATTVAASEAPTATATGATSTAIPTTMARATSTAFTDEDYLARQTFEDLIQSADDQEQARLALAEINMAKEQKFASRIESVEGGADYVAASLMDSILLERRAPK